MVLPTPLRGSLVACHPHPLFGGTMTNKVVHSMYKAFRDAGFAAIRFDFRGAGESEGEHGQGITELLDVQAAAAQLDAAVAGLAPTTPGPRVLGGFSFGSLVGLRAASEDPDYTHRIGIGPPLAPDLPGDREYDWDFLLDSSDRRPLVLVAGDQDEFCPSAEFVRFVERLRSSGIPVEARLVPEANHFFDRKGHVLRELLEGVAARVAGLPVPDPSFPTTAV